MNVDITLNNHSIPWVYSFGDSWAYGSELDFAAGDKPFVHWFAEALSIPYTNYGVEGSSLAMILNKIVTQFYKLTKDSIVLVIIPPDVRWYSETQEKGFYTIKDWDEYVRVAGDHSVDWFVYHHAMFIYAIQKILEDAGCYYIMAHNYGSIERLHRHNFPINYSKFLSQRDLTSTLSNRFNAWERFFHDPEASLFTGEYFEGCIHHPNNRGHKRIAELMLEKYYAETK